MKLKKTLLIIFLLILPIFGVQAAAPEAPIRVLIVPGHDNLVWGAQYGNIKEADMTLALANKLYGILTKDKKFKVYITRNSQGYTKTFADYFSNNEQAITDFKEKAKTANQIKIDNGTIISKEGVVHNAVTEDTSVKLYGINKWANENKIDLVIHIHFNDYPRPTLWTIGKYKGFVVYMPDSQMANAQTSDKIAKSIFTELSKKYTTSTYPKEKGGLISDQKLIALGASGTLNKSVRSVLIEYGYIYEKKFRNSSTRHQAYTTMANLTATGIKNYFGK